MNSQGVTVVLRTYATVVGFILLSAAAHAASSAAPAPAQSKCDASILPSCDALAAAPIDARKQLGFGTPRDGGVIFNSQAYWANDNSTDEKLRKSMRLAQDELMKRSPAREKRAYQFADTTRKKAIDFLKQHSPDSPERKILIDRLNSVTIDTTSNPPDTCGPDAVPKGFPNLGYSAHTNTLYICTPATNLTETQLVQALTHELGHVVSPCMAQSKVYKVDREQLFPGPLAECVNPEGSPDGDSYRPDESASTLLAYQPAQIIERQLDSTLESLKNCSLKILTEIPGSSVPSSETFASTKACLLKKLRPSLEQSEAFKLARTLGQTPEQAFAHLKASNEDVCTEDFEESFADSFSASFLGQIAADRNWSANDLKIANLDLSGFACYEQSHGRIQKAQYDMASVRIRNILSDPQTAAKLRCEIPKDTDRCELKFSATVWGVVSDSSALSPRPRAKPSGSRN